VAHRFNNKWKLELQIFTTDDAAVFIQFIA